MSAPWRPLSPPACAATLFLYCPNPLARGHPPCSAYRRHDLPKIPDSPLDSGAAVRPYTPTVTSCYKLLLLMNLGGLSIFSRPKAALPIPNPALCHFPKHQRDQNPMSVSQNRREPAIQCQMSPFCPPCPGPSCWLSCL